MQSPDRRIGAEGDSVKEKDEAPLFSGVQPEGAVAGMKRVGDASKAGT